MSDFDLYVWTNDPIEPEAEKQVPCEVYSRIVGYVRPIQQWNVGKQQEWAERQVYEVPEVEQ